MIKKIFGILLILLGIALIGTSSYIKVQVEKGKAAVGGAERGVAVGKGLFSLSPITKEVSKEAMSGIEKKIREGKGEIAKYEKIASWTFYSGIILIVLGAIILFLSKKKMKK